MVLTCVQIKYHEEFEKSKVRSDAPPPENRQGKSRPSTHIVKHIPLFLTAVFDFPVIHHDLGYIEK